MKYYPFKKQIQNSFSIPTRDVSFIENFVFFFKQVFWMMVKVLLLLLVSFILFSIIEIIKTEVLLSRLRHLNFDKEYNLIQDDFNNVFSELQKTLDMLNSISFKGVGPNNIIDWIINFITNVIVNMIIQMLSFIQSDIKEAFKLLSEKIDPITIDVKNNFDQAQLIFYICSLKIEALSIGLGFLPFIGGGGDALSHLSDDLWNLGNMVNEKYNDVILPVINNSYNNWNTIVYPFTSILESIFQIIFMFTGLTLFLPIMSGNTDTFLHLPVYFWLSFIISIIFLVIILFSQLLSISASNNQKKKQKIGKNIMGGITITVASFIIIPLFYIVLTTISIIIIESVLSISVFSSGITTNDVSKEIGNLLTSLSYQNGATMMPPDWSGGMRDIPIGPYGYYLMPDSGGLATIIITKEYFNYTMFIIGLTLVLVSTGFLACLIIAKTFNLLSIMILGPIVNAFFIKDGGLAFRSWVSSVGRIFFEIIIIVLQLCLILASLGTISYLLNDFISHNNITAFLLLVLIYITMIISIFIMFTNIKKIFFKEKGIVNATLNQSDLEGLKVDSMIKNKSLEISSKNLTKVLNKNSMNLMKRNELNLSKSNKNAFLMNREMNKNINNMKIASDKNINELMRKGKK